MRLPELEFPRDFRRVLLRGVAKLVNSGTRRTFIERRIQEVQRARR